MILKYIFEKTITNFNFSDFSYKYTIFVQWIKKYVHAYAIITKVLCIVGNFSNL